MTIKITLVIKIILFTIISLSFSGCSSKELYESIQPKYDENECRKLPPHQYEECIKTESKSYDEYKKDREDIIDKPKSKANLCSRKWYSLIEKKILTGDNHGHGPDLGSTEWRSVIEFKLGIRGEEKLPPLESEQWCKYINDNYIKVTK